MDHFIRCFSATVWTWQCGVTGGNLFDSIIYSISGWQSQQQANKRSSHHYSARACVCMCLCENEMAFRYAVPPLPTPTVNISQHSVRTTAKTTAKSVCASYVQQSSSQDSIGLHLHQCTQHLGRQPIKIHICGQTLHTKYNAYSTWPKVRCFGEVHTWSATEWIFNIN